VGDGVASLLLAGPVKGKRCWTCLHALRLTLKTEWHDSSSLMKDGKGESQICPAPSMTAKLWTGVYGR
jgi:hypothetical protein